MTTNRNRESKGCRIVVPPENEYQLTDHAKTPSVEGHVTGNDNIT
ncbi:hypothetical protein RSSM_04734 [Rhodopirellula sallentina SM41]|uniref:Uncharacterized protein n=1 Tax=Rhodopirellula sallentina SM41 TaxID=1263870 RepID=M5TXD2_9BACT|nr:hypothetical protein RSSM_04734 [Rhodopirellula sallentina SM41]